MSPYSKAFVFVIFAILGLSFWATTATLYWEYAEDWRRPEFEGTLWFDLMTHYSHVYLFFPLFGTVALFAFFLPAAVFVDMYWRRAERPENDIPHAKFRFCFGFVVAIVLSAATTWALNLGDEAALWQIKRDVLKADGRNSFCAERGANGQCARVTFATALENVRRVSQDRERLTDLTRQCVTDPLIERLKQRERRFCFVTARYSSDPKAMASQLLEDKACCTAIDGFEARVRELYAASPQNHSRVDLIQHATLGLKIFFLLVVLVISVLLAFRHRRLMSQYGDLAFRVDRGVLIGTIAMLFLPFMNHAFMLSTELIYGPNDVLSSGAGVSFYRVPHALSIAFGIWGFFIMLFFIRREDKEAERMTKIISAIVSGVFVLKYDAFLDYAVRYAGPGLGNYSLLGLVGLAAFMCLVLAVLKLFWGNPPEHGPARKA